MASVNKVIVVGHLGSDPETRYTTNGDAIANLSIATSEKYKDKSGQQVEHTEWHKVSFFGRMAEVCGEYLTKGSLVYVEGSLRTRKWQDKEGNDRYTTEIKGERMQMLGGGSNENRGGERREPSRREEPRREAPRRDDRDDRRPAPRQEADDYRNASGGSPRRGGGNGSGFDDLSDDIPFLFNQNTVSDTMGAPKGLMRARHGKGMLLLQANKASR